MQGYNPRGGNGPLFVHSVDLISCRATLKPALVAGFFCVYISGMAYARCSHCQTRKTLAQAPEKYYLQPKCPKCGKRKWRLDKYRQEFERGPKGPNCKCHLQVALGSGYWFTHRKGSRRCAFNPDWTAELAQAIYEGRA